MDIVERLNGYNPPDRTHDLMRPIATDIQDAKREIEKLRESLQRNQRPEGEKLNNVIEWIKSDPQRVDIARSALKGDE